MACIFYLRLTLKKKRKNCKLVRTYYCRRRDIHNAAAGGRAAGSGGQRRGSATLGVRQLLSSCHRQISQLPSKRCLLSISTTGWHSYEPLLAHKGQRSGLSAIVRYANSNRPQVCRVRHIFTFQLISSEAPVEISWSVDFSLQLRYGPCLWRMSRS